jgi:hypothetical protein
MNTSVAQVWTSYSTNFSFQNHFLKSNWILNEKNYSKFNIFLILDLKTFKISFIKYFSSMAFQ